MKWPKTQDNPLNIPGHTFRIIKIYLLAHATSLLPSPPNHSSSPHQLPPANAWLIVRAVGSDDWLVGDVKRSPSTRKGISMSRVLALTPPPSSLGSSSALER